MNTQAHANLARALDLLDKARQGVAAAQTQMATVEDLVRQCRAAVDNLPPTANDNRDPEFEGTLRDFVAHVQKVASAAYGSVPITLSTDKPGPKYVRIVRSQGSGDQRSVYAFVELATGNIFMPDGWKKPAKHARGNIYKPGTWTCAGPYGIARLR